MNRDEGDEGDGKRKIDKNSLIPISLLFLKIPFIPFIPVKFWVLVASVI
jgi:hypothetical protein